MCFYEKRWLDQFKFCDVLLYRRCIDDGICFFNYEQNSDELFKFFNSHYSNITFTFEKLKDDNLAFLNVLTSKVG